MEEQKLKPATIAREELNKVLEAAYRKIPQRIEVCIGMGSNYLYADHPLTDVQKAELQEQGYTVEVNLVPGGKDKISW